jgi:hypothetical protein
MSWLVVLEILVRLFGPVLVEWLRELLIDAAEGMTSRPSADPETFRRDLSTLFARARGRTWAWQLRKRAALRLAETAALNRSVDIFRSATSGGFVPPLSTAERVDLESAIADWRRA